MRGWTLRSIELQPGGAERRDERSPDLLHHLPSISPLLCEAGWMEGCDRSKRQCGLLFSLSHTLLPSLPPTSQVYLFRSTPPSPLPGLHPHTLFHLLILFSVAVFCLRCLLLAALWELSASPSCCRAEASSCSARVSLTSSLSKKKEKGKNISAATWPL